MALLTAKMIIILALFVINIKFISGIPCLSNGQTCATSSPALISPQKLIELHGFHGEAHEIPTHDGYMLEVHRVYGSKHTNSSPIIVLQHGFAASSMIFLLGPSQAFNLQVMPINGHSTVFQRHKTSASLAFTLAEQGYDVWMLNSRGNTYSSKHVKYNPKCDREFWQFSLQEMAMIDLPTEINYITDLTGQADLAFIGVGQGATLMLWLLADQPQYSSIIKPIILIDPYLSVSNMVSNIKVLQNPLLPLSLIFDGAIYNRNIELDFQMANECQDVLVSSVCTGFFDHIGYPLALNHSDIAILTQYLPAGTSIKSVRHYLQAQLMGELKYYDEQNMLTNFMIYQQFESPRIKWDQIISENIVLVAPNLADNIFGHSLPVTWAGFIQVPDYWSTLDYLFNPRSTELISSPVVNGLNGYFKIVKNSDHHHKNHKIKISVKSSAPVSFFSPNLHYKQQSIPGQQLTSFTLDTDTMQVVPDDTELMAINRQKTRKVVGNHVRAVLDEEDDKLQTIKMKEDEKVEKQETIKSEENEKAKATNNLHDEKSDEIQPIKGNTSQTEKFVEEKINILKAEQNLTDDQKIGEKKLIENDTKSEMMNIKMSRYGFE